MPTLPPPPPALVEGAALFLDFDGTLIELAETPDSIDVPHRLGPLLARLHRRLGGRLAVVSGRALDDLELYVPASGIAFSGSHGLELRFSDGSRRPIEATLPDEVRARVRAFAAGRIGLLVEEKPAGIALHYRLAPGEARAVSGLMDCLAREHDLVVQHGKMVTELRPAGADKGDAVRALMMEPPFRGARPVFVGDDLTDEHAFRAASGLGGAGILVGPERETAAHYRLPSVAAAADWLESIK